MDIGGLYPMILTLVLVGVLLGVGLTVLAKLGETLTGTAGTKVNDTITAIGGFTTWLTIIVIVIAASVIISLVLKSFTGQQ
jgi:type II secretory pathway component PulF